MHKSKHLLLLALTGLMMNCAFTGAQPPVKEFTSSVPGHARTDKYLPLLAGKRVAVLTNASGVIGRTSLVDSLLKLKVKVKKVFVPEHGFRGEADAGVKVSSAKDKRTGLPIVSLYGKNKKPLPAQLADVDVVVYDIQDLGVRFYTYISTLSYMMEACAENKKKLIVLDRPNPNGFYIDGPLLEHEFRSFLGLHPVPVVYGMTCGEYARMVNGEGWLANKLQCDLTVIEMGGYDRSATYLLPVKPSPNIPNHKAVLLYPSLGLFEGTVMSLGRGTDHPFQVVGHPEFGGDFSFTPLANNVNREPRYAGKPCYGLDLREDPYLKSHPGQLNLDWLIRSYTALRQLSFFEQNFNYHAGNAKLQEQIKAMIPAGEIRSAWQEDLEQFREIRKKYLLYPDCARRQ